MSNIDKSRNKVDWYDNPTIIINILLLLIALIIILSQNFAVNSGLDTISILSNILNHNVIYLLVCVYFVALKTRTGKKYFDFLNIFLIFLYFIISVTSIFTVLQSFGLSSLLVLIIDLILFVYIVHTFLRSTRIWSSLNMKKSPFNEINNSSFFSSIVFLSITLLAVNLVSTTSLDGAILELMDMGYIILFARYIFLYGEFLNIKKISVNNNGNFDVYKEKIIELIEEKEIDKKFDEIKNKVGDFSDDIKGKVVDVKDSLEEKWDKYEVSEKLSKAKDEVKEFVEEAKDKAVEIKKNVSDKIEEAELDKKFSKAKEEVKEFVEGVKDKSVKVSDKREKGNIEYTSRKKKVKNNKKENKKEHK